MNPTRRNGFVSRKMDLAALRALPAEYIRPLPPRAKTREPTATRPVTIRDVGARRRGYAWPNEPRIKCGEPALQQLFDASVNTLHNSCQETVVDGMGRERQQYSGDCAHQLHAVRYAFGETKLPARFLKTMKTRSGSPIMDAGSRWWTNTIIRSTCSSFNPANCASLIRGGLRCIMPPRCWGRG